MVWAMLHVMVSSSAIKQSAAGILVLFFLLTASLAGNDHDVARRLRKTGDIVPVEQILKTLGGTRDVRVLEITLRERDGHLVYSVEYIDPNGVVLEKQYDAKSGVLLQTRQDDE